MCNSIVHDHLCDTRLPTFETLKFFHLLVIPVFSRAFLVADVVQCEDAGRAAYTQLHLHVNGEYNCQQAAISC